MNAIDLANAYVKAAQDDPYLVCVAPGASLEELQAAEQVLIERHNAIWYFDTALDLALDLIEHDIRTVLRSA